MRCDVCGLDNAASLMFCQDCGRRLKAGVRVVPPTPPIGLTKVELPATEEAQGPTQPSVASPLASAPSAPRSRPEAPSFSFSPPPPIVAEPEDTTAPDDTSSPTAPVAPAGEQVRCDNCETDNPAGYRFCVCCGAALTRQEPRGAAEPAPEPSPSLAPSVEPSTEPQGILTRAVVDLAATQIDPPRVVTCARCQGRCLEGTRYCKFCGAPLDDAAAGRPSELPQEPLRTRRASPAPGLAPGPAPVEPSGATRTANSEGVSAPTGRLICLEESGAAGAIYPLSGEQVDIGRTEGDILLPDDPYASPRHARLLRSPARSAGEWAVRDLASTNKVYLRIRKPTLLHDGDLLIMGLQVLQFEAVSESERELGHASENGTLLFGSAAKPCYARLRQRTVEGVTRDVHHLTEPNTVIGRENADIVFTADPFLSRRHAVIRRDATTGGFTISDLESSHGVFIAIREDTALVTGDQLRIGQHLFRTELG